MRVLHIEDSETIAVQVQSHLLEHDVKVIWLRDIPEQVDCKQFEVILLDLNVPNSEGLDTVLKMRRLCPNSPIVILTAEEDQELLTDCIQSGAASVHVKGDGYKSLVRAMRLAIGIQKRKIQTAGDLIRRAEKFFTELDSDLE